ncbi:LysM peptidoglycan-binding domain-containing protein [Luteolibacter luteus]|uniref:LysM peptidoglycan-binding domain-containing protein n=1 Tax=Luteolibacter luteus TaxID=2728835 RepID=A0A858RD56_9BACT|nr:LysM peptidoglycan-binding domain-containing protein [Luteolibacter luteus]QJE94250.1 LysM peptidoglycan-binding domain-containing protein [Luteolibacter luteus]
MMRLPGAQVVVLGMFAGSLLAQTAPPATPVPAPAPPPSKAEAGLEEAVNWKWSVAPSAAKDWGMPLPDELKPKDPAAAAEDPKPVEVRPTTYEVQKGDALVKIARKFNMTVAQLKQFNELKNDRIVIGQSLKIPTPGEILAMEPPPPPPPEPGKENEEGKKKKKEPSMEDEDYEPMTLEQLEMETVLIQVFLDREMFSCGAIDGKEGPTFQKITQLYQSMHPELADPHELRKKALAELKQPYANYVLRADDFRFIKVRDIPPAAIAVTPPGAKKEKPKPGKPAAPKLPPPLSYEEMVAEHFLGYASAWEFVAERFHCDEAFLRRLNDKVGDKPAVGTIFQVPNVIPYEIEKAGDQALQPAADPQKPVTAEIVDVSILKVSRDGKLIAAMPLASARPGLRGRGSWTVLDAIAQPKLVTKHEPREAPKATADAPAATPAPAPVAEKEETLAAGPNNPVGVVWINLAKAKSKDALSYGLHGTGIPAQMKSKEGIGGFRMTNWDIDRAVRLLPAGTPLVWPAEVVKPRR